MGKPDVAKKAIDSIGKPKRRYALEAEKELAKMSSEELAMRQKLVEQIWLNGRVVSKYVNVN